MNIKLIKILLNGFFLIIFAFCGASNTEETYKIGSLEIERWQEYKAIALEAVRQEPYAFFGTEQELSLKSDSEWIEIVKNNMQNGNCIQFAFDNNVIIGTASLIVDKHEKLQHIAQIASVYVKPEYRRKGVGKKLIQMLIEKAKSYSFVEMISLQVTTSQKEAISLYESLGFKKEGIVPKLIKFNGIYKDQYIMIMKK